jgi:putative membrane protein
MAVADEPGQAGRRRDRSLLPPDPRRFGNDPDYRFTLANERTFLAWVRTSLALTAGGLAAVSLIPDFYGSHVLGVLLLFLAVTTAATSYRRWAMNETAMRLGENLPRSRLPQMMAFGTAAVGLVAAVFFVIDTL